MDPIHIMEDVTVPRRDSDLTAWVNVIFGCNERCTYCVVPNTRGREQSRDPAAIKVTQFCTDCLIEHTNCHRLHCWADGRIQEAKALLRPYEPTDAMIRQRDGHFPQSRGLCAHEFRVLR